MLVTQKLKPKILKLARKVYIFMGNMIQKGKQEYHWSNAPKKSNIFLNQH